MILAETPWDLPKLLHVAGAMVFVGTLLITIASLAMATRGGSAAAVRLGFRTLLLGALPSWLVMRVAAQFALDEGGGSDDSAWVGIGYAVSEIGLLFLIVATVLTGIVSRRGTGPDGKVRVAAGFASFLLLANIVAIWAMTTKPD